MFHTLQLGVIMGLNNPVNSSYQTKLLLIPLHSILPHIKLPFKMIYNNLIL